MPGLPLGAGMNPYNCPATRGEALMGEFTGSETLTKIHAPMETSSHVSSVMNEKQDIIL